MGWKRAKWGYIFANLVSPNLATFNLPPLGSKSNYLYDPGPGLPLNVNLASMKSLVFSLKEYLTLDNVYLLC